MAAAFCRCESLSIEMVMIVMPNCCLSSYIKESYLRQLVAA
jgi:hypothetical protein